MKDSYRGPKRDAAFQRAVEQAKTHFKKCTRCGKWVCPETCWNAQKQLCEGCAPNVAEELAAAQASAAVDQVRRKAASVDYVKDVDVSRNAVAACPTCGASVGTAKFCPNCGEAVGSAKKIRCAKCNAEVDASANFCPECGTAAALE